MPLVSSEVRCWVTLAVAAAGQVPYSTRYAVVCRAAGFLLRCTAACRLLFASSALARLLRLLPVAGCGWARTARLLAYACCWGAAPLDEQDTMAVLHWWSLLCGVVTDGDAAVWSTPPPSPLDGARRPSWVAGRLTDPPRRRGGTLMQDHTAARCGASAARARQEAAGAGGRGPGCSTTSCAETLAGRSSCQPAHTTRWLRYQGSG